jgi:AcrR family transcriptional regulator
MQHKKTDRRIQRTQQMLQDALIALILEKGYAAITVQDLLDRANLGRSTFYAHYRDKEDLLVSGFGQVFAEFERGYAQVGASPDDPEQAARSLSLYFFRHTGSHRHLFRAMIGKQGGEIIIEYARKFMSNIARSYLAASAPSTESQPLLEPLVQSLLSSYLALLTWWLEADCPFSPEQMNAFYFGLVRPGVKDLIDSGWKISL